jgi:hypothetical protein
MSDDWLYGGRGSGGRPPEGQGNGNQGNGNSGNGDRADDATRPVPGQRSSPEPGPDETRVMPTVSREQSRASAARSPRETPPPPPGRPSRAGAPQPPPRRPAGGLSRLAGVPRPRFRLRYLWLLLVLWVVYLIAVPFFAWSKADKVNAFPSGHRPADQSGTNYLLVGSDSRAGLTAAQR